jgi:uncharacterized membrane protein YedE/YeeE
MKLMSLIAGLLFGIGLIVSGMVNPDKVIGFLDITGEWDPALMFVMGGAVTFNLFSFMFIKKKATPITGKEFHWPTKKDIDCRLIVGSSLFGIGWGLAGICPGPGLVNISTLNPKALVFVGSMIIGMIIFKLVDKKLPKVVNCSLSPKNIQPES